MSENNETKETNITDVLLTLANKVSRKAVLLAMAMVLIYMIAVTPTATNVILSICVISCLSLIGVFLQYIIDKKNAGMRDKRIKQKDMPPDPLDTET